MRKHELMQLLELFSDDIRILVKHRQSPNIDLLTPEASYVCKIGDLRLRDGSLLENGEGYIEVLI
jgi:hypothetical protein